MNVQNHIDDSLIPITSCKYYEPQDFCNQICTLNNTTSFFHLNCQGLSAKWDKLAFLLSELHAKDFLFDFISLSEIYHHERDRRIYMPGYHPFVSNVRENCNRGGVGMFIRDCYEFTMRTDLSIFIPHVFESVFIECKLKGKKTIVGVIYRPNTPPRASVDIFTFHLFELLTKIEKERSKSIIMGDMNIDLIKSAQDVNVSHYVDQIYACSFVPTITIPTRVTPHCSTLLDHIYANGYTDKLLSGVIVSDISDHYPVFFVEKSRCTQVKNSPELYRPYTDRNVLKFVDLLERMDFSNVMNELSCQDAYDTLAVKLEHAHNYAFPRKKRTQKHKRFSPWITPGIIQSSKTKHKLFNKSKKNPTDANISAYKAFNGTLNRLKREAKGTYFAERLEQHKSNSKKTWELLHHAMSSKPKSKASIKGIKVDGTVTSDSGEIADEMNKYFCNVSQTIREKIPHTERSFKSYLPPRMPNSIFIDTVAEPEVILAFKTIKTKTSSGHDELSTKLLRDSFHAVVQPITHVINRSLMTGIIPHQLKQAKVIPIHKSGDSTLPQNYRPISLLPAISKILERVMCNRVTEFLDHHNLLFENQYGFRKSHSTIHPLLQLLTECANAHALRPPSNILSIFCDLSKAFDVLGHDILLYKMSNLGIRGIAHTWFRNYLSNRSQFVQIDTTKSSVRSITHGVPQGSILGPLLFLIYVNDIQHSTTAKILSFADDTSLVISANNTADLITSANNALSEIYTWFCSNKLYLNLNKTTYMTLSTAQKKIHIPEDTIKIGNTSIIRSQSAKFLGVHIDEHLTWKTHLSQINKKISSALYAMKQVKHIIPAQSLRTLYHALIHPHLTYGILAWGNADPTNINNTFLLQKRALRTMHNAEYRSHTEPLFKKSNILKLNDLVQQQIAAFTFDLHNKRTPPSFNTLLKYTRDINTRSTRSTEIFYVPTPHNKFLEKLPPFNFPKIANKFHQYIHSSKSRKSLTKKIKLEFVQHYSETIIV